MEKSLVHKLGLIAVLWNVGTFAFAQSESSKPREIDNHFAKVKSQQSAVFRNVPVTHISPSANSFIFAMMFNYLDAKIDGEDGHVNKDDRTEELKVKGYNFAPYLAFSGKMLGIGLALEHGRGESSYKDRDHNYLEQGKLNYSGLGTHVFFNPFPAHKNAILTLVGGAKYLDVKHHAQSNVNHENLDANHWEELRYYVVRTQLGGNLSFQIFESVALVPWANYAKTYTENIDKELGIDQESDTSESQFHHVARYQGDRKIFWESSPNFSYGLDVAIKAKPFQFHIGTPIGAAINAVNGNWRSKRIKDYSFSFGITYRTNPKGPSS